jgi:YD repeat-containing protein
MWMMSRRRLVKTIDAAGEATLYAYDDAGNLHTVTDPLDHVTTYGYDWLGRRTSVEDATGHVTTFTYDDAGNLTSVTDPLEHTTTYEYDDIGRLTSVTDPLDHTTTYAYNAAGWLTSRTNSNGKTESYTYDTDWPCWSLRGCSTSATPIRCCGTHRRDFLTDPTTSRGRWHCPYRPCRRRLSRPTSSQALRRCPRPSRPTSCQALRRCASTTRARLFRKGFRASAPRWRHSQPLFGPLGGSWRVPSWLQ